MSIYAILLNRAETNASIIASADAVRYVFFQLRLGKVKRNLSVRVL